LESAEALALHLELAIDPGWPPQLYDRAAVEWGLALLEGDPDAAGWGPHYFAIGRGRVGLLVGAGGFKGKPDASGEVEIGYSIVASHRGKGLATAAAEGMVARAFADPRVTAVIAQTLPSLRASIRVLEKAGFHWDGEGDEKGVVRFIIKRK
jgi:RimJ/RimL family protein N-acetyltransferase